MSDGITEAYRGTYFRDRSKLPYGYNIEKEKSKRISFWKRIINIIKMKLCHFLNQQHGE